MKIDIKESAHKENEYKLGTLYKDSTGDVFYFVQIGKYFNVNYLIMNGHLVNDVVEVGSHFQSIQEVVNGLHIESSDNPETPVPAKKLTLEF